MENCSAPIKRRIVACPYNGLSFAWPVYLKNKQKSSDKVTFSETSQHIVSWDVAVVSEESLLPISKIIL